MVAGLVTPLRVGSATLPAAAGARIARENVGGIKIAGDVVYRSGAAPPPPPRPRHTFRVTSTTQRGYNRPGRSGSLTDGAATGVYATPDGTSVTIWHCRVVGSALNFALSGAVALAQFPARIVVLADTRVVGAFSRPGSVRSIGDATRGDYALASGNLDDVFVNGSTFVVQLWDS